MTNKIIGEQNSNFLMGWCKVASTQTIVVFIDQYKTTVGLKETWDNNLINKVYIFHIFRYLMSTTANFMDPESNFRAP